MSRLRLALLGVTLGSGCAVYEKPTLAVHGAAGSGTGFGGSYGGEECRGPSAEPETFGGRPPSLAVVAGQAGANDNDRDEGTAGSGGAPGDVAGGAASGAASSGAGESPGGNGGAAGAPDGDGGSAGVAASSSCAAEWRNQSACDQCATQVQPDLQACAVILDCYVSKDCGPSSCAGPDQKCGPNVLRQGAAAYWIAQNVFACMCE